MYVRGLIPRNGPRQLRLQGNHAKCAHLYNPALVRNGRKINVEPIIILCICILSGKKRGGISAASQDQEDTKEMSETRLVLSGGEGYVDFRIGMLSHKHTHTNLGSTVAQW